MMRQSAGIASMTDLPLAMVHEYLRPRGCLICDLRLRSLPPRPSRHGSGPRTDRPAGCRRWRCDEHDRERAPPDPATRPAPSPPPALHLAYRVRYLVYNRPDPLATLNQSARREGSDQQRRAKPGLAVIQAAMAGHAVAARAASALCRQTSVRAVPSCPRSARAVRPPAADRRGGSSGGSAGGGDVELGARRRHP